jgi:hypothetical protein
MAKSTGKSAIKNSSSKRTLMAPKGDKRFVRRDEKGRFMESDDVSKSLSKDVKQTAKTKVKPGQGDKGDQPQKKSAGAKKSPAKKK